MQEAMQAAVGAWQQAMIRAYLRVAGVREEREAGVSHVLEVLGIVFVVVAIITAIQALKLGTTISTHLTTAINTLTKTN